MKLSVKDDDDDEIIYSGIQDTVFRFLELLNSSRISIGASMHHLFLPVLR